MLLNLIQNALKFTMKGGISVTIDYIQDELVISVQDTGIGISETDQQKLFQLFGKLSSSRQMNTSGIGLGLSICKRILDSFAAEISVDSVPQEGSQFTFSLKSSQPRNNNETGTKLHSHQARQGCEVSAEGPPDLDEGDMSERRLQTLENELVTRKLVAQPVDALN